MTLLTARYTGRLGNVYLAGKRVFPAWRPEEGGKKTTVVVFVNGDKFDLPSNETTVGHLIELGGGTRGQYELQQREGERGPVIRTYTDPNESITVKDGEHFTTRFIGPINPS